VYENMLGLGLKLAWKVVIDEMLSAFHLFNISYFSHNKYLFIHPCVNTIKPVDIFIFLHTVYNEEKTIDP